MKRTILASLGLAVAGALAAVGIGVATAAPSGTPLPPPVADEYGIGAPKQVNAIPVVQGATVTMSAGGGKTLLDPRIYGDAAGPVCCGATRFPFSEGWADLEIVPVWVNPPTGHVTSPTGTPWVAFINSTTNPTARPAWFKVSQYDATRLLIEPAATGPATTQVAQLAVNYRSRITGETVWNASWTIRWMP